jgi:acetylornithine deacetylase/succinyl-diaminopimelate desuccinylase-like protein
MPDTTAWSGYLDDNQPAFVDQLRELVRIPSISALPEHAGDVARAAEWVASRLRAAGVEGVRVMPSGGHPAVVGEWLHAPGKPTITLYGHFDVQPVDPLALWTDPPFDAAMRDGRVYGRGSSDMKGGVLATIIAVETLLKTAGALPVNVKFLFEGQEEIGSPEMAPFLAANHDLLATDYIFMADGGQWSETEPSLSLGLRGIVGMEVHVTGANSDLHSGGYGGTIANPLHALVELLASMHHPDGKIAVDGFYDRVDTLTPETRARIATVPFDEAEYLDRLGVPALFGEPGYSTYERTWVRPTLELNGIWGGFQGEGNKTVLPNAAHAKITCRLVPDQDPSRIAELVRTHIQRHAPKGVRVEVQAMGLGANPYVVSMGHPGVVAAHDVVTAVYGREPYYIRSGGSVPISGMLLDALGVYSIPLGFALKDERSHAPNEFFRLSSYRRAQEVYVRLLERVGRG